MTQEYSDKQDDLLIGLKINFGLSGQKTIEKRVRYNLWSLVSDVGGFYFGLRIIGTIMIGSYARLAYEKEFLDGILVENINDKRTRNIERSARFTSLLRNFDSGNQIEHTHLPILVRFANRIRILRHTICAGVTSFCSC